MVYEFSNNLLVSISLIFVSYLLGSLSSAIIVCRIFKLPDPRTKGSNNPGATNVLRIGGKFPAICTLLGDALKGVIAVLIAKFLNADFVLVSLVIFAVFIGHLYPVFFKFQGGKGVATAIGAFITLNYIFGFILIACWLVLAKVFKISSLAAILTAIFAPVISYFMFDKPYWIVILCISMILVYRHKDNIKRLIQGSESKIIKNDQGKN